VFEGGKRPNVYVCKQKVKATEAFFSFGLTTKVKNSDLGFYFFS
jgi:hypothetical protein